MKERFLNQFILMVIFCIGCSNLNAQPLSTCEEWYTYCASDWDIFFDTYQGNILCRQWNGQCATFSKLDRSGKVSIGTESASSQQLTVKGGIIADKVLVTCWDVGWCDYVFEDDYDLLLLKDVEKHIQQNGHLHNTPSGAHIEKAGSFELKAVTLNHQEKIEEVFLHLIDLKKEANTLEKRLEVLKKENELLKAEQKD